MSGHAAVAKQLGKSDAGLMPLKKRVTKWQAKCHTSTDDDLPRRPYFSVVSQRNAPSPRERHFLP